LRQGLFKQVKRSPKPSREFHAPFTLTTDHCARQGSSMRTRSAPAEIESTPAFVRQGETNERIQPQRASADGDGTAAASPAPVRAPVNAIGWGSFP
jgi:hypothetical protein